MSFTLYKKNPTAGEITSSLTNSSDGGAGLHFNGVDGTYVEVGDSTILDGATRMSAEVIFSSASASTQVLISKDWATRCFNLRLHSDGTLKFNVGNGLGGGSTNATAQSSGTYNDGNPKHVVATWDNATLSIYVNGNLDGTATLAGGAIPNTADFLALGCYSDGGSNRGKTVLDGDLYRARLWNKALSSEEVTSVYESASVPSGQLGTTQAELIANGNFASAAGWTLGTGWTVASNKATSDGSQTGNSNIYRTTAQTVVLGKNYRVTFTVSGRTAGEVWVNVGGNTQTTKRLTNGTFTEEVVTGGGVTNHIYIQAGPNFVGSVTDLTVTESGAVADFDLAFANPTQSTIVQDRAGAADGTAAGGVSQISPIEQLNSKAARIGTSAATPADGELLVSGKGYFGDEVKISHNDNVGLSIDNTGVNGQEWQIMNGVDSRTNLQFKVGVSGGAPSKLLMLLDGTNDRVGIGPSPASPAETLEVFGKLKSTNVIVSGMATSDPTVAGQLWNDSGTVKISAG